MSASAFTATEAGWPGDSRDRRPHGRAEVDHWLLRIVGRGDQHRRPARGGQLGGEFCASGGGAACPRLARPGRPAGSPAAGAGDAALTMPLSAGEGSRALGDLGGRLRRLLLGLSRRGNGEVLRLLTHENRRPGDGQDDAEHRREREPRPRPALLRGRRRREGTLPLRFKPGRRADALDVDRLHGARRSPARRRRRGWRRPAERRRWRIGRPARSGRRWRDWLEPHPRRRPCSRSQAERRRRSLDRRVRPAPGAAWLRSPARREARRPRDATGGACGVAARWPPDPARGAGGVAGASRGRRGRMLPRSRPRWARAAGSARRGCEGWRLPRATWRSRLGPRGAVARRGALGARREGAQLAIPWPSTPLAAQATRDAGSLRRLRGADWPRGASRGRSSPQTAARPARSRCRAPAPRARCRCRAAAGAET